MIPSSSTSRPSHSIRLRVSDRGLLWQVWSQRGLPPCSASRWRRFAFGSLCLVALWLCCIMAITCRVRVVRLSHCIAHERLVAPLSRSSSHIGRRLSPFVCASVHCRARTVVITRIFGLMINNNKTDGLVPMADMCTCKHVCAAGEDRFARVCARLPMIQHLMIALCVSCCVCVRVMVPQ